MLKTSSYIAFVRNMLHNSIINLEGVMTMESISDPVFNSRTLGFSFVALLIVINFTQSILLGKI